MNENEKAAFSDSLAGGDLKKDLFPKESQGKFDFKNYKSLRQFFSNLNENKKAAFLDSLLIIYEVEKNHPHLEDPQS